ncbi:MAG TPA: glycosyltransferase family 1 protein [Candidatus Magasanikbacteria bacterium]|nr:glycosyltransferase family 1 protein [Candidatus Magasanikbacteria bacterium]
MNIGIDIRPLMSPIRTGVGEYTYELLNAIFQIDKENQYFLFYNNHKNVENNIPRWDQPNVHYVVKKYSNKLFNLAQLFLAWPKIDKMIAKQNRLDKLDYFFSPNLNFTALTKNVKYILTIHDLSFELFPEFFTYKDFLWHKILNPKKQCQLASVVLTPSKNTKRDLINIYALDKNKIETIYPGLSSVFHTSKSNDVKKYNLPDNYVLFLGSIEPRKNILSVIEAWEKAYSKLPLPYHLVMVGAPGWKNSKVFEKIKNSPLREKINFIGYIKNEDKPEIYRKAAAFIYPSFYEGFGFPVLEAMHCKTPVITSNRSSIPEITDENAYLVDPNRPLQITAGLIKILNDQNLSNTLKETGQKRSQNFSWDIAAKEFLKILK